MFIQVDGQESYVYTGGKSFQNDKPCIVFIHGAQNDHSVWILQSRFLAHHGYNVLAIDLPGHGRSAGLPLKSIEAQSAWLLQLLAVAKVDKAVLVGHSMGSLIALETAAQAPALCLGLGLFGTAFPMKVSEALLEACARNEAAAFDLINRFSHSSLSHIPGSPGPGFSVYWQGRRLMERQAKGVLLNDFEACNNYVNGLQAAAQVTAPTLILSGENDAMTPPKSTLVLRDSLTKQLGGKLSYRVLTHCGHALMAEQPDETLLALRRFLDTIAAQS